MANWHVIIYFSLLIKSLFTHDLSLSNLLNIDDYFNWKIIKSNCINQMQKQGLCEGSYAIVAASVLSDRFCIKGLNIQLSSQCK